MRRLLALLALTALGACENEIDESTRPQNIAGTYQLVSYAGKPLPAPIPSGATATAEILAGELVLTTDLRWTETQSVLLTFPGSAQITPVVSSGTWALIRSYAYLVFNDTSNGYQFSGTAAGGTIVLETVSGSEMIYRR